VVIVLTCVVDIVFILVNRDDNIPLFMLRVDVTNNEVIPVLIVIEEAFVMLLNKVDNPEFIRVVLDVVIEEAKNDEPYDIAVVIVLPVIDEDVNDEIMTVLPIILDICKDGAKSVDPVSVDVL
jgi:bifunctional DNase/RNase